MTLLEAPATTGAGGLEHALGLGRPTSFNDPSCEAGKESQE
ncbi:hypothetical protein SAMN05445756_0028 [Kytococcus aerolatus]|uniref:Uncharacterized protein n=1 Tax=Kytococcus aerolatus TaxID=592308 RepID=A0A212SZR1_9MICO|nr:hypothetical protein SAMN05445756_0028 [Kytococcus aerolatus]